MLSEFLQSEGDDETGGTDDRQQRADAYFQSGERHDDTDRHDHPANGIDQEILQQLGNVVHGAQSSTHAAAEELGEHPRGDEDAEKHPDVLGPTDATLIGTQPSLDRNQGRCGVIDVDLDAADPANVKSVVFDLVQGIGVALAGLGRQLVEDGVEAISDNRALPAELGNGLQQGDFMLFLGLCLCLADVSTATGILVLDRLIGRVRSGFFFSYRGLLLPFLRFLQSLFGLFDLAVLTLDRDLRAGDFLRFLLEHLLPRGRLYQEFLLGEGLQHQRQFTDRDLWVRNGYRCRLFLSLTFGGQG